MQEFEKINQGTEFFGYAVAGLVLLLGLSAVIWDWRRKHRDKDGK